MSKFEIINVKLGDDIDQIINEAVECIANNDKEHLLDIVKNEPRVVKIDHKTMALTTIYNHLLSQTDAIPAEEIFKMGNKQYANISGLISSLKSFIRNNHNNDYVIVKENIDGKIAYRLKAYNV